jgi:hypothetical protein
MERDETYTVVELLSQLAFCEGLFYGGEDCEDGKRYSSTLILYNYQTEESELVIYRDADEFCEEVDEKLDYCRPVAVEVFEDDEEKGYPLAEFWFLDPEPSIDDEAVIEGMFGLDEKTFIQKPLPLRPVTKKVVA